jgi:hypothetical protein
MSIPQRIFLYSFPIRSLGEGVVEKEHQYSLDAAAWSLTSGKHS